MPLPSRRFLLSPRCLSLTLALGLATAPVHAAPDTGPASAGAAHASPRTANAQGQTAPRRQASTAPRKPATRRGASPAREAARAAGTTRPATPAGTVRPQPGAPQAGARRGAAGAAARATAAAALPATTATAAPGTPPPDNFAGRVEVKAFISEMVEKHGFDQARLLETFSRISPDPKVLALMNPPRTSIQRSWRSYRERFLQPVRIEGGLAFWQQHAEALARARREHGVPAEIIVAIIGIETVYGRNTGNFQVLRALATLGFDFPSRAPYFRRELEQFLLYTRENSLDPLLPRGSYAGAIGMPQFMPGSIRNFAADFDGSGQIDLRSSPTDAIGSVARFLQIHGWVRDLKTHYPATLAADADPQPLLARGPRPDLSIADLRSHGITSPLSLPADQPLMLVDLVNADAPPDYAIGTGNFYAITRYNRSFLYAMAVIELADAIRTRRTSAPQPTRP